MICLVLAVAACSSSVSSDSSVGSDPSGEMTKSSLPTADWAIATERIAPRTPSDDSHGTLMQTVVTDDEFRKWRWKDALGAKILVRSVLDDAGVHAGSQYVESWVKRISVETPMDLYLLYALYAPRDASNAAEHQFSFYESYVEYMIRGQNDRFPVSSYYPVARTNDERCATVSDALNPAGDRKITDHLRGAVATGDDDSIYLLLQSMFTNVNNNRYLITRTEFLYTRFIGLKDIRKAIDSRITFIEYLSEVGPTGLTDVLCSDAIHQISVWKTLALRDP